MTGLISKRG